MDVRIDRNTGIDGEPDRWVHSACGLCSNVCGLEIAVRDDKIVGVRGDAKNPITINLGHLGPKGENVWRANSHPSRGTHPMVRRESDGLAPCTWDEPMSAFIARFNKALRDGGRQSVAVYNSGQLVLEEYYVLGKSMRAGVETPNLDANTRLCTATPEFALEASFRRRRDPLPRTPT